MDFSTQQKVTLLGATGSIGESTLDVIRHNSEKYCLYAAVALHNSDKMYEIIVEFLPKVVALYEEKSAAKLQEKIKENLAKLQLKQRNAKEEQLFNCLKEIEVLSNAQGVNAVGALSQSDIVVGAIVGASGLPPLLEAIKQGKRICLANKEALVMTGQYFFDLAKQYGATILPVDSEHSAIFQCLPEALQSQMGYCDLKKYGVKQILLTGSGGPFRELPLSEFSSITPKMAISHPVWSMGPKISVDSSTMMNKALEFIEARYLFNAAFEEVQVVIHPQSVIHSMVSYVDGAVLAQLGNPSMKTPIARAMAFPERIFANVEPLDFTKIKSLTFDEPHQERYPCLYIGMQASKLGQAATTALNAANEVAVEYFLNNSLPYIKIAYIVEKVVDALCSKQAYALEEILEIDKQARLLAKQYIENIS